MQYRIIKTLRKCPIQKIIYLWCSKFSENCARTKRPNTITYKMTINHQTQIPLLSSTHKAYSEGGGVQVKASSHGWIITSPGLRNLVQTFPNYTFSQPWLVQTSVVTILEFLTSIRYLEKYRYSIPFSIPGREKNCHNIKGVNFFFFFR